MARPKDDRRGKEPRHVRLYHSVTSCAAWQDLSGNAVKLLIALLRMDKGGDNGSLFLSVRMAADMIRVHRNTAVRLFQELEDHGFIAPTDKGHFRIKGGAATTWRVTWLGAPGYPPTRDFERWTPETGNKSRSQKNSTTVTKIVPPAETPTPPVTNIVPGSTETSHVSNPDQCTKTVTQVVCHGHSGIGAVSSRRKQANSAGGDFELETDAVSEVRDAALDIIGRSPPGKQTEIARRASIPGGTFSKFLSGRSLGRHHLIALQSAIASEQPQSGRAARAA